MTGADRITTLRAAEDLITGERDESYGDAAKSFKRIATVWSALLGFPVTPAQVAMMMVGLKLCRLATTPDHEDSWIDVAGYAALGSEVAADPGTIPETFDITARIFDILRRPDL